MTVRIGIMGGAFNPPHFGHLRSALEAKEFLSLERVVFLPSGGHPFKGQHMLASATHRLAMTKLAAATEPDFCVSDLDVAQTGISYTIDTLAKLGQLYPGRELVFLLGTDLLAELHLWKEWQNLIQITHLCLLARPGFEEQLHHSQAIRYFQPFRREAPDDLNQAKHGSFGFLILPVTALQVSSSELRGALAEGRTIRFLTPESVVHYIHQNRLYSK